MFQPLVANRVIGTMHGDVDRLGVLRNVFRHASNWFHPMSNRISAVAARLFLLAIVLANREQQIIDWISHFEQRDMRLQRELRVFAKPSERLRTQRRQIGGIESFNVCPFQLEHVGRERIAIASELPMIIQPLRQPRSEIAERKRG